MGSLLKTSLSLFGIFILAFIVVGFLLPRENGFSVTKSIPCTPKKAFSMINELKNWETWSPWKEDDPNMKRMYSEISSGKDAWCSWDGNRTVGKGKLTILDAKADEKLDLLLHFNNEEDTKCSFRLVPSNIGTDITWQIDLVSKEVSFLDKFTGGYKYLLMKFFLIQDFNKGLDNLKKNCP